MFKYFRRQRSRLSLDDNISIDQTSQDSSDGKRNSLRSVWSFGDERIAPEDNPCAKDTISLSTCDSITSEQWNENDDVFNYQSRLSMSMSAVVNNRNCLSYFVQYLETKNCLSLIKFYLDSEHFKAAAINQLDLEQKYQSASSLKMELRASKEDIKHNVPELKSLCDLSMRKPLTDDEKSQIYAETTEKISQCCAGKAFTTTTAHGKSVQDLRVENVTASKDCISAASITDALAIYEKYLIEKSEQFISIPVSILSQISLILCKNEVEYDEGGKRHQLMVPTNCFDEAQQYILQRLEDDHLPEFLQSLFYCRYCVELIENISKGVEAKLTIYDILYSEMALFFFMEFLEQQHDRNYLDFWTAAINFRRSYLDSEALFHFKESEAQADAMIIYEKYFSLQSSHQLDLLNKLRCIVEESICTKGNIIGQCFDLPLQATADYLRENHLDDFLQSPLFENYLHELKFKSNERRSSLRRRPTFRRTAAEKKSRHRKTLSDCSNETFNHLSQLNFNHNSDLLPPPPSLRPSPPPPLPSLLSTSPSGGNNFETFLRTPIMATTNLGIDAHQFITRSVSKSHHEPTEGRLRFGHINALGRYERESETFDTLSQGPKSNWSLTASGNKIKSAMRKLVNLPEDNMQEEIAWQVAEMIVKDVTDVTKIKFRESA